jgi:tetratricopeptide (TPR) repeat protein
VKSAYPETWARVGETALLSLVFLAPLAAHARTYDPAALKTALFESGAMVLAGAWLLKGLSRGRWEAASASWPALAPVLALAAWTLARFAAAPFKDAALPDLALTLSAWIVYAVALLEFGGARSAARVAFWTAAAAALVGALGAAQRLALSPGLSATLTSPDQLAAFAAAALPVVLALRLDPEASPARRLFSASTAAALALLAAWSGSARGLAAFALSALAFAAAAATILRGPEARRTALISLGCAAAAVLISATAGAGFLIEDAVRFAAASRSACSDALRLWSQRPMLGHGTGSFSVRAPGEAVPDSLALRALAETGLVGAALLAWTALAAATCGLRAAAGLRRRGALAEAGYAAAFAAAFAAWTLSAALGLAPAFGPGAWLAWAAAGLAAGMLPLARPRGIVLALPLPYGEDVRRLLQGPLLVLFAVLAAWPGGWLASDVRYNRAVAEARTGGFDAALADVGRVWPGSPLYTSALYLRGRVLMDQGKPREALDAYARLDEVSPDFSRLHARRAEAYAALGDWPASARERARQGDLTPLELGNLTAWAEAARAAGDIATARRVAARAHAIAPDDESVRLQVAANALLEKRVAETSAASRRRERKAAAFKSRLKPL